MVRTRKTVVLLLAIVIGVAAVGCKPKTQPKLLSAWPTATLERTVAKPPTPPRWPLTGLVAPTVAATRRRVLSIKIENSPQSRPQTGLQSADVVYEEVTEGGITRFNALFQSRLPRIVGPVRSARLADLWIVPQYHALLFFSGANQRVNTLINRAGLPNLSEDAGVAYPYYRASNRSAPHNLYLDVPKAYEEARRRKMAVTGTTKPLNHLRRSGEGTVTVRSVYVPLLDCEQRVVDVRLSDKELQAGEQRSGAHRSGHRQADQAKNVVVLWARHVPQGTEQVGGPDVRHRSGRNGPCRRVPRRPAVPRDVDCEPEHTAAVSGTRTASRSSSSAATRGSRSDALDQHHHEVVRDSLRALPHRPGACFTGGAIGTIPWSHAICAL